MTLQGKVALVTGSTKGLGKAIVVCFASLGADVVVSYSRRAGRGGALNPEAHSYNQYKSPI